MKELNKARERAGPGEPKRRRRQGSGRQITRLKKKPLDREKQGPGWTPLDVLDRISEWIDSEGGGE